MAQLAIRGHATRGREVIENLGILGGENGYKLSGTNEECAYYEKNGRIHNTAPVGLNNFKIFTLEEFLEKFPYKVGDKVLVKDHESPVKIVGMIWNGREIEYRIDMDDYLLTADDLQPYKEEKTFGECVEEAIQECLFGKEETMEERENSVVVNIEHKQLKVHSLRFDKTQLMINDEYELKQEGDAHYIVRKKPQYPKTYEECLKILGYNIAHTIPMNHGHNGLLMMKLQRLLICRDAYWKIAGDWKPDWRNNQFKYIIVCAGGNIINDTYTTKNCILAFPTSEMRDAFYENFKDLIEQCKELL